VVNSGPKEASEKTNGEPKKEARKAPYSTPVLTRYGDMAALTRGTANTGSDAAGVSQ
jgi:hypothetical protein